MAEAADEQKPQASTSAVILSNSIDTSVMSSRAKPQQQRPAHLRIIFRHLLELIVTNNYIESFERRIEQNDKQKAALEVELALNEEDRETAMAECAVTRDDLDAAFQSQAAAWEIESARILTEMNRMQQVIDQQNLRVNEAFDRLVPFRTSVAITVSAGETGETMGTLEREDFISRCNTATQEAEDFISRCNTATQEAGDSLALMRKYMDDAQQVQTELQASADGQQNRVHNYRERIRETNEDEAAIHERSDAIEDRLYRDLCECRQKRPVFEGNLIEMHNRVEALIPQMVVFRQEQLTAE